MPTKSSTTSHSVPVCSEAASCQTSALMNRKVTKISSSGRARVIWGSSEGSEDAVRRSAHARIGRTCSTVRA